MSVVSFPLTPRLLALLLCAVFSLGLRGQGEELKYYDNTYVDNIKAVRLHVAGFPSSYPLINLGEGAQLRLSFDDTSDEVVRYSYRFIHCDQDWQPSGLSPLEYNSGFSVDYVDEYDFSLRTLKNYVHYELDFPNRNMKLNASGNYLLVVYNAEEAEFPVITRRFLVSENLAGVGGRVMQPSVVSKIHTHQEVDITVNTEQLPTRAPLQELSASVIQNYRWDNAIIGVAPNLLGQGKVHFNYQGKIIFPGHNEYRNLDIRSVRAPRSPMVSISNEGDRYAMMMEPEPPRGYGTYSLYFDLNGDFVTLREGPDQFSTGNPLALADNARYNVDYTGEYIEVTFVFNTRQEYEKDVYIFGGLTEYQLKPEYRMVWNPTINAYVGRALVKQGFYNYHYVEQNTSEGAKTRPADRLDYYRTEGNYDQTENNYLALIYWRPLGGRYDRLVGTALLNSNVD